MKPSTLYSDESLKSPYYHAVGNLSNDHGGFVTPKDEKALLIHNKKPVFQYPNAII